MALTTLDKKPVKAEKTAWPPEIAAEFEQEKQSPNGCVGQRLLSEDDRVRVWEIRLKPGQRFGFHRHVLDFSVRPADAKARAYLSDGTTVEHTYKAGETRHGVRSPKGHFKVHDLANIGDTDLDFITVEFLDSANKPLPIPDRVRVRSFPIAIAGAASTQHRAKKCAVVVLRGGRWIFRTTCSSMRWSQVCSWARSTPS